MRLEVLTFGILKVDLADRPVVIHFDLEFRDVPCTRCHGLLYAGARLICR